MTPYQNYSQQIMPQNNPFNNYVQSLQNQISSLQNQIQNYQQYFNGIQQQVSLQQTNGMQWTPDGNMNTNSHKPISDDLKQNMDNYSNSTEKTKIGVSDEVLDVFKDDIEEIKNRLTAIEKSLSPKRSTKSAKEDSTE